MDSLLAVIVISALAVLGLYFLWNMLGELIFGDGKTIAVVPVTSAEPSLAPVVDTLRAAGVGHIILVDYNGKTQPPEQPQPQRYRIIMTRPERLGETLAELEAGH